LSIGEHGGDAMRDMSGQLITGFCVNYANIYNSLIETDGNGVFRAEYDGGLRNVLMNYSGQTAVPNYGRIFFDPSYLVPTSHEFTPTWLSAWYGITF
jgi:hypothetical protein